jgi:hypothetical protein
MQYYPLPRAFWYGFASTWLCAAGILFFGQATTGKITPGVALGAAAYFVVACLVFGAARALSWPAHAGSQTVIAAIGGCLFGLIFVFALGFVLGGPDALRIIGAPGAH